MLRWHRLCAVLTGVLLLYVVLTGAGIQLADMRALVTHAPETDPDMLMMRQHIYGPPNYAVVSAPDYTAPVLPATLDPAAAIGKAAVLGHAAMPGAALRLVEIRTVAGKVAGHVRMGDRDLIFDLASGAPLPASALPPPQPDRNFPAPRAWFKFLHRFNYLGQPWTALNLLAGLALVVMIVTGIVHYARLLRARRRTGRQALFWRGGGWWRDLHRWISVAAAVLVLWLAVSGTVLAIDNVGAFLHGAIHGHPQGPSAFDGDFSTPLRDAELPGMTDATLAAFRKAMPDTAVKVLRLRYFAGYPQGVVVAGDADTSQLVFDTATGARLRMWEKGYPDLNFPSGWEWHQRLKRIHRGDIFGMPGRWLDTLGALALVYLAGSGVVIYGQAWARRRRTGRPALLWK